MKASRDTLNAWLWVFKWTTRILGALSVAAGAIAKFAPSALGFSVSGETDDAAQKIAMIVLPFLLILVPISDSIRRWLERKTLWPLVKEVLDDFRKQLYPNSKDPAHLHRTTLFKHCGWVFRRRALWPPSRGWLKVVERSGHTTRNSRTVFFAPNDPDKAEGVAGLAWAWNQVVFREDLPDVRSGPTPKEVLERYATDSNTALDYVAKHRPTSRSLCGIPVEVSGEIWGVLVVDSRDPKLPKELIEQHHAIAAKFISRVLERV